jgi:3-hydroxyisobutyrate dehydrogenase
VGLGGIGRGLASAVAAAGLPLAVLDVRTEATEPFADRGRICTTPAEIGRLSEVLLVSVVTDEQVLSVVEGALPAMPPGSAVVVVSTVKLETVEQVADLAARAGVGVVDCGVSGGPVAAAEGVLVSMVGGDDGAVERARPAIEAFSSVVVRMGPLGSGQRAKLARNLIQYGSWYAAHEGMRLAEAAGIPLTKLAKVVRESDAHIGGASRLSSGRLRPRLPRKTTPGSWRPWPPEPRWLTRTWPPRSIWPGSSGSTYPSPASPPRMSTTCSGWGPDERGWRPGPPTAVARPPRGAGKNGGGLRLRGRS